MPSLLGLFKNSPKNSPRASPRGTPGMSPSVSPYVDGASTDLAPVSSHLAPISSIRSSRTHRNETLELQPPIDLLFSLESGPLIMYGSPEQSSGALLSGILDLDVREDVVLESSLLRIIQKVTYKAGASGKRRHQATYPISEEVLAQWDILLNAEDFYQGIHEYPFSHLLPGALPPTVSHSLFDIEYYLEAHAVVKGKAAPVKKIKELIIGRSVESVQDKTSVRLFPPTELNLSITLPSHIFPKGSFVSELRVENLNAGKAEGGRFHRWTIRKISWSFLETTKLKLPNGEDFEQEEVIYHGALKSGWKFDGSTSGIAEIITREFSQHPQPLHKDVSDDILNIKVSHKLSVEVLIAEETCTSPNTSNGIPTGKARVLRVHFNLSVVDTPGLGISWDDEVPPVYADVPLSPPTYDCAALEEIHHMTFSPLAPAMSPTLRHVDPNIGDGSSYQHPVSMGESFIQQIQRRVISEQGDLRPIQSAPARHH